MRDYILRRVLLIIPTVILVSMMVFAMVRFMPGDTITALFEEQAYFDTVQKLRHSLGLDRPIHEQYLSWMWNLVRGDLGASFATKRTAVQELQQRLPVTLELGIIAILLKLVIALPVGIYSAMRQDTATDYVGRSFAILMLAVPNFWIATLVVILPAVWFGWMPSVRYVALTQDPLKNLGLFILPAFILGSTAAGPTMRLTRTMMLEVLRQDYIRTAWAKGLRERMVVTRHALKNAFIPIVTIIGLSIPSIVGGSVIIETIFGLPGVGWFVVDSVNRRDYPMIQAVTLAIALFTVLTNLLVDLTYGWLDPRIRYK